MKVLYLGSPSGTSGHRAAAFRRLGHDVQLVDPHRFAPDGGLAGRLHFRTGSILLEGSVRRGVLAAVEGSTADVTFVDSGRLVGPSLLRALRPTHGPSINFNHDDPFGHRDGRAWALFLRAVPEYDLVVVVRDMNVGEARAAGAKNVLHVFRTADEVAHAPRPLTPEDHAQWGSDVSFVGTWMPERGPFMARLLDLGVPLSIRGNLWEKASEWPRLRSAWVGPGVPNEEDYARAIQCAKVNLGLLSVGNRDRHTTRSAEVPLLGGLLCAQRTDEHRQMYVEDQEAVFWDSPEECAEKCRWLLSDDAARSRIAAAGHRRVLASGNLSEPMLSKCLAEVVR